MELRNRSVVDSQSLQEVRNEYSRWSSFNEELLKRIFTTEELSEEYVGWTAFGSLGSSPLAMEIKNFHDDVDDKIHRLKSIVERLELIPLTAKESNSEGTKPFKFNNLSKKVFLVHGHDEAAKANLEVFLQEIGLEPVVLHRQADEGQTVIEKFEKHSEVGYAFILLTPDEVAYVAAEEQKPDADRTKERRARPNVIFEFGYFVGKLGRSRCCCLYTGGVNLPSDIGGMIYKKYDRNIEEVGYSIQKDLKAAGYQLK